MSIAPGLVGRTLQSMSNELVETSPETPIGEEVTETPEVVTQDATDGAEKPAEPAKTPEQLEIDRLKRELAHKERALTKRDRTQGKLHQEREQLSAEIERLKQGQPAPAEGKPALGERDVMTLAEQIAARREFDAKCNTVAEKGKEKFKDFSSSLNALIDEAGPLVGNNGVATALGEQILASDDPAELIQYLGKNPELAAELDGLSTPRIARKLAAFELQMTAKPKTSGAPKPLEPVKGTASGNELRDDLSTDEWLKRRRKQLQR